MHFHLILLVVITTATTTATTAQKASGNDKVLLCYWGSWSTYRSGDGKLEANMIDPNVCTHILYGFAGLNNINNEIRALDAWNDLGSHEHGGGKDNYRKLISLKKVNPDLKVLLSIGGWNEGSEKYSSMASFPLYRKRFIDSVVTYLRRYGFDGLDFAWEWPTARGGSANDKKNYVQLLKELRTAFTPYNFVLTVAAPALEENIDNGYDLPEMIKYADYINVYAYDYYVDYQLLNHGSPLYNPLSSYMSVNNTIRHYLLNGVPAEKLILGVTLYGRSFHLAHQSAHEIGDPALGPASRGPFTQQLGVLAWFELCKKLQDERFVLQEDPRYQVSYGYNTQEWLAYESEYSLQKKVDYAGRNNLAGIAVWSLENDDNHRVCGDSLVSTIRTALDRL